MPKKSISFLNLKTTYNKDTTDKKINHYTNNNPYNNKIIGVSNIHNNITLNKIKS